MLFRSWAAIEHSTANLDALLGRTQSLLTKANGLTTAAQTPQGNPPPHNPAAAEACVAWKDYVDALDGLKAATGPATPGATPPWSDKGEEDLVQAWKSARDAARNALAELLSAQKTMAEKLNKHEQRQAPRPDRSESELKDVVEGVRSEISKP